MDTTIERFRPTALAPPVIDPLLEDDTWQLGYVTGARSLLPIRSGPDFRSRLVTHHLGDVHVIAGRSALFVWGARMPDVHEIYPRAELVPDGVRVLDVHLHYRDFIRFDARIVTEPYRSVMDVMQFHGLNYLSDIVDVRSHLDPAALAHRCRASRIPATVWHEVIDVLTALG